ncbi:UNVERIFIED_CONTAM: mariner\T [Trichonephila clavipes]
MGNTTRSVQVLCSHSSFGARTVAKRNGRIEGARLVFTLRLQSWLISRCIKAPNMSRLGDSAVSERTARHWFQKFRSGDLSLCDKARTGRPQALYDEALQAAIGKDSSQTCGELVRQFNTSSEIVRLYVHRLGKTYRLSKWVPHTLLEVLQQREAACLSLHSRHLSASILNRVLISDRKWL